MRRVRYIAPVDGQQKSYNVSGAGSHTLKWVYIKDGSVDDGDDCGWVDCVQWTFLAAN